MEILLFVLTLAKPIVIKPAFVTFLPTDGLYYKASQRFLANTVFTSRKSAGMALKVGSFDERYDGMETWPGNGKIKGDTP